MNRTPLIELVDITPCKRCGGDAGETYCLRCRPKPTVERLTLVARHLGLLPPETAL